jgi:hypothetical protein
MECVCVCEVDYSDQRRDSYRTLVKKIFVLNR